MRCASLTTLFFVLFALFSTMAYAAPIGARGCVDFCRETAADSTTPGSGTNPAPTTPDARISLMSNIIAEFLDFLGKNYDTPNGLPPTSTAVDGTPTPTATPASAPTGTPRSAPTLKWFTEIAIPSPTPSGA